MVKLELTGADTVASPPAAYSRTASTFTQTHPRILPPIANAELTV